MITIAGKPFDESNFLFVPSGEYAIGIDEGDLPRCDDMANLKPQYFLASTPRHQCHLEAFAISKWLVTVSEFARFVSETDYVTDAEKEGWAWLLRNGKWQKIEGLSWQKPFGTDANAWYHALSHRLPVLQTSWNDAQEYCRWLSRECARQVHVPTECQWEVYANLSGIPSMKDSNANDISSPREFCDDVAYLRVFDELMDDAGNCASGALWEWCDDWYDAYPGGVPNREFGRVYKVLRGGSLFSHPLQRTRECRFRRCPTARSAYYGFRIAIGV